MLECYADSSSYYLSTYLLGSPPVVFIVLMLGGSIKLVYQTFPRSHCVSRNGLSVHVLDATRPYRTVSGTFCSSDILVQLDLQVNLRIWPANAAAGRVL